MITQKFDYLDRALYNIIMATPFAATCYGQSQRHVFLHSNDENLCLVISVQRMQLNILT